MKAFIYGDKRSSNQFVVEFKLLEEKHSFEYQGEDMGWSDYKVDMKEVLNFSKAMNLLSKKVVDIQPAYAVSIDLDTKYYHRFDESVMDKIYRKFSGSYISRPSLYIKGNRFYTLLEDGTQIVMPENISNMNGSEERTLTLVFTVEEFEA